MTQEDTLILCPFTNEWLPPDQWLASQQREAHHRQGLRFTLRNALLRIQGKPTKIHGRDLDRGARAIVGPDWSSL